MPGGAAGLQNQSGGRKVPGGFDSLPSPPARIRLLLGASAEKKPASNRTLAAISIPCHKVGNDNFFRGDQSTSAVVPAHADKLPAFTFQFIDDRALRRGADGSTDVENFMRGATAHPFQAYVNHGKSLR